MITVFAYWFGLLWNVSLDKEAFAIFSIVEFGTEIVLILLCLPTIILMIKELKK